MKIDHIGYAVKRLEKAKGILEDLGFEHGGVTIDDTDRNIQILFCEKDGYRIELVAPLDGAKPSPVDAYLKKVGPTVYHICYKTSRFEEEIGRLQEKGFHIMIPPEKAVAFQGRRVVFLADLSVGLIEIVED